MSLAHHAATIEYPDSDRKPLGETDVHRAWMIRIYDLLSYRYRGQQVYVGSDLLLYYTEGQPANYLVPDDFVVLDCDASPRRTFQIWQEQRVPNVVFEVTSQWTRREDEVFKPRTYARIGIRELFLYDPTGDYLRPPLQGFRLAGGEYARIEANATGDFECHELGLLLRLDAGRLVMVDAQSGTQLLTEAEAERTGREAAEAEVARLRAELARRLPAGPK